MTAIGISLYYHKWFIIKYKWIYNWLYELCAKKIKMSKKYNNMSVQ